MVQDDAASDQAMPTPAHASNGLWPAGSDDRLGPLARRGSRLPHDVPEALVTSPVRGSGAVEGAPGVDLQPGPAGQFTGSDSATGPDTGVVGDRSDIGRSDDVRQRGLGELLRRWEDVQPDDTATTFPGAKPIPMRSSGTTPPEDAPHAGPSDLTPPNAPPFDATRLGATSLEDTRVGAAAPFDANSLGNTSLGTTPIDARLGATPFEATSLGATPLDDARLGATPFDAGPLGGTPVGGAPGGTRRPGGGPEFSGTDHVVHTWPAAVLAPADLLGNLEDEVEEALEALVLREAERYGLDAGAP